MAYVVDRVVICDAFREPDSHYELMPGGRSRRVATRRPSMRFLASAKDVKGGIGGVVGKEAQLFDDLSASTGELNTFVNELRDDVRVWREAGWPGTAVVTRRLLEWWFERDEERGAVAKRFFFCQQEAVETVIYLYEVQNRQKMRETGDLLRYALKLATGTGKTVVMALFVTWATLHKRKVSGSSLSTNFLVLVPNLTVRSRVQGVPRGDGLDSSGDQNLYEAFEMVPPEYREEFHPNVLVRNWQNISLEPKREDWIGEGDVPLEEGRFVPQAVLRAMQKRAKQDPNAPIRRLLGGWRDLVVINDEAHHVYGEKKGKKGEDAEHIKWSKILSRIGKAAKVSLVLDLSATPWYGSGSPKPEGTLFEWLVSDFSVYDAFESGLVKVVRLPDPDQQGRVYLDLWDLVKGAKTKEEYLRACKGAIASHATQYSLQYIELFDPESHKALGLTLAAQSKVATGVGADQKPTFDFWCAPADLEYWLAGNMPVILVVSDPASKEAWWVPVKEYFKDWAPGSPTTVTFKKDEQRFTKDSFKALVTLAAPRPGLYLAPARKAERLHSNLLRVDGFPERIYFADTECRWPSDVWALLRKSHHDPDAGWVLRGKRFISFHDLSEDPWTAVCDGGTVEGFPTTDWSDSTDPDRQHLFIQLMNQTLRAQLREGVRYWSKEECFALTGKPRKLQYQSLRRRSKITVISQFSHTAKDGRTFEWRRHMAFRSQFRLLDGQWCLEITPTYRFTTDGYELDRFHEDRLKGIKQLEGNRAVLSCVLFWADYLRPKADLFANTPPPIRFGDLLTFSAPIGINDKQWLSDDPEFGKAAELQKDALSLPDIDDLFTT